jgi:curved DNA-binding protein CbpA
LGGVEKMTNPSTFQTTWTYYEILDLSPDVIDSRSPQEPVLSVIKRAYHRALLTYHPDKITSAAAKTNNISTGSPLLTIDQISNAFAVLSDPARRAEYDKALRLAAASNGTQQVLAAAQFQTGIENVDLDDLEFEDTRGGLWFRKCRCGNPRGYSFGEVDLDDAAQYGELMIGCADCSLWLRVHFAVVDDDSQDGNDS